MKPTTKDAYMLMHNGILALSDIERNGIRVDINYFLKQNKILEKKIFHLRNKIEKSEEVTVWKSIYKSKFNLDSTQQLASILFKHMKIKPVNLTPKGSPSVDQASLEALDVSFVKDLLSLRKYQKAKNTYLTGMLREVNGEYIHPFFNLHTVRTFRSSSDSPNFQNIPIRDRVIGKIIRTGIIPRPGNQIVELDYSGLEVSIAACHHKDPVMLEYLADDTKDMHRDTAAQCFMLPPEQVTKETRFAAKNGFVFPEFYGDYYKNCAKSLWDFIGSTKLKTVDGIPLHDHLKENGIRNYKRFEKHIKTVEDSFWEDRFLVYGRWKEQFYRRYLKHGYFDMKTGFRCSGLMRKNEVLNFPVQGSAFHCLLKSLISINSMIKEWYKGSYVIGQIHDSIILDVKPDDLEDILRSCRQIMCSDLKKDWNWVIVDLDIEAEVTPVDGNWFQKKEMKIK